jgi:predicted nucleic acid-binding protein
LATKPRYYWDACSWIGLINQEAGRIDSLRYVNELAQKGDVEIWTSTFTLAEVFKKKCADGAGGLPPESDKAFEDYLEQDHVRQVQVDSMVGTVARRLLRKYPKIKKPQDAIHLATAILNNVDEFHTYDGENLLPLDGQIDLENGGKLKICHPPVPPDPNKGSLFDPAKWQHLVAEEKDTAGEAQNEGGSH